MQQYQISDHERQRENERIETVEPAAVPRQNIARILHAGRTLEHRLDQIAQHTAHGTIAAKQHHSQ